MTEATGTDTPVSKLIAYLTEPSTVSKLIEYLAELNTISSDKLLIKLDDTHNIIDWRVDQHKPEGWEVGGTLGDLSFGHQSFYDSVESYLDCADTELEYQGVAYKISEPFALKDLLSKKSYWADEVQGLLAEAGYKTLRAFLMEGLKQEVLDQDFAEWLYAEAQDIRDQWSLDAAHYWVYQEVPEIFSQRD